MVNSASTWANQTSGSAGQKGGSLMLTAATVGVGSAGGVTVGGSESSLTRSIVEGSVVAIVEGERGELNVHQGMRSQGRVRVRIGTSG